MMDIDSIRKKKIYNYVWNNVDPVSYQEGREANYASECAICRSQLLVKKWSIPIEIIPGPEVHLAKDKLTVTKDLYVCGHCDTQVKIERNLNLREDEILTAISKFAISGVLPIDSYRFDINAEGASNCVFCYRVLSNTRGAYKISVPQGTSPYICSHVLSCPDCTNRINEVVEQYGGVTHQPDDECPVCSKTYSVTLDEYNTRINEDELNTYCCNDCCLEVGITGLEPIQIVDCCVCKTTMTLEITKEEVVSLLKLGEDYDTLVNNVRCRKCKGKLYQPLPNERYYNGVRISLTDNFQYVISKDGKTFSPGLTFDSKLGAALAAIEVIDNEELLDKYLNYGKD